MHKYFLLKGFKWQEIMIKIVLIAEIFAKIVEACLISSISIPNLQPVFLFLCYKVT